MEVREREGYVPVEFNHLAIAAKDKQQSATFLKNLLGPPEPTSWGPFLSLTLDDGIRLDYAEPGVEFRASTMRYSFASTCSTAPLNASELTAFGFGPVLVTYRARSTPTTAGGAFTSTTRPGITSN